jgi:rhodanese-related sulfurtransferase
MKKLIIIALLLLIIPVIYGGCDYITGAALNAPITPTPTINNLTPEQAHIFYMASSFRIKFLDVRTWYEYEAGHIADAINYDITAPGFEYNINQLPREEVYIVYCVTGVRSAAASKIMIESGFLHVYNIYSGGFNDLVAQGFLVEK